MPGILLVGVIREARRQRCSPNASTYICDTPVWVDSNQREYQIINGLSNQNIIESWSKQLSGYLLAARRIYRIGSRLKMYFPLSASGEAASNYSIII
jgi:hypothetical protein